MALKSSRDDKEESKPMWITATDDELLAAWGRGDVSAGACLLDRYFLSLRRFFWNKDPQSAEDLLQKCMLAAVEGRARLRESCSFRAYLFGIARNLVWDQFRKRARERKRNIDESTTSIADLRASPSQIQYRANCKNHLISALQSLPIESQMLIELHYWERLNTEEIAEILNIPLGTCRGRLRRSRQMLHRTLLEHDIHSLPVSMNLDTWAQQIESQVPRMDAFGRNG